MEFKTSLMPEAEHPPTLNIHHAYMLLPFDETKRTRQKTAHTSTTVPARSRAAELCEEKR